MATDAAGPSIQTKTRERPKPNGPAEVEREHQRLDFNVKLFSSATISNVIKVGRDSLLVEVRANSTGYIPGELPVPFPMKKERTGPSVRPRWDLEKSAVSIALRRYSQSSQIWNEMNPEERLEQMFQFHRFNDDGVGSQCLSAGADSFDREYFKLMVRRTASDYLKILCLEESNDFFMCGRPDTHFEIKALAPLAHFEELDGLRIFSQVLGSIQMSCVLRHIVHHQKDGYVSTYIRGAITDIFKYDQAFLRLEYRDESFVTPRVNNPAVFAFRACQYADAFGNRVIVDRCIDDLKSIEGELGNPDLATDLSARLNELSKELGQVTNLLAQKEIEWQHSMGNSQKTIAIVTMFFLPATFFAILFTLPLFNWDDPDEPVVRRKIWTHWVFTGASTIAIFALYFSWDFLKKKITSRSKKGDEESQNVRPVIGATGEEKEKKV